jgi:hypothetical protein
MKSSEYYWQNFELGKELEIAGGFIYDGLRNLHEMETVRYESEIFSVLYSLSVGLERFLKVTVVLLEFDENTDSTEFEKRLMTHNHSVLVDRIKKSHNLQFDKAHNELLSVLTKFYKSYRYDRYSIRSVNDLSKEKKAFLKYLKKYLGIDITENPPLEVVINERCIREFTHFRRAIYMPLKNTVFRLCIYFLKKPHQKSPYTSRRQFYQRFYQQTP